MFGSNMKFYREKVEMSQKELAERLAIAQSMVARLERGTRQPSIPILQELSKIFGVTIDELVNNNSLVV